MKPQKGLMAEKEYSYTVFFEPSSEGGYIVSVPALPGLITEGDTIEEARAMARDAIQAYLESLIKDGEKVPEEKEARQEKVAVSVEASS